MGEGHDRHSISPIHLLTCGLKAWLGFPLEQRALAAHTPPCLSSFWPPPRSLPQETWLYNPPTPSCQEVLQASCSRHMGKQLWLPWPFYGL